MNLLKKYAKRKPIHNPITMPKSIEKGIFIKLKAETPSPCIIPTKVENKTITYTSSQMPPPELTEGFLP